MVDRAALGTKVVTPAAANAAVCARISRAALVLAVFGATACTYGPIIQRHTLDAALPHTTTRRFVAIVRHEEFREPTGLAAFPDGGSLLMLKQWVDLYVGNVDDNSIRRVASITVPDEVWVAFGTGLAGWRADTAYARLTGCPRKTECSSARLNRLFVRVDPDGRVTMVADAPKDLERRLNMVAQYSGEQNYTRLNAWGDSLKASVVDGGPLENRYILNKRGELEPLSKK